MIGVINGKIKRVPLAECAGKLKMVSPKDQIVKAAKQIGISFGDWTGVITERTTTAAGVSCGGLMPENISANMIFPGSRRGVYS